MDLKEFQSKCAETAIYDRKYKVEYSLIALHGEVGEIFNKLQKAMRDDDWKLTVLRKNEISSEIGDCFWFAAMYALDSNADMSDIFVKPMVCLKSNVYEILDMAIQASDHSLEAVKLNRPDRDMGHYKTPCISIAVKLCITNLCCILGAIGHDFDECLERKLAKLADRKARGVIAGSGDNR